MRWDSARKLHFYLEFSHIEEPTKLTTQLDPPLVVDEETTRKGTKVVSGTGAEPALIINEQQGQLSKDDLTLPIESIQIKQQLRQVNDLNEKKMATSNFV